MFFIINGYQYMFRLWRDSHLHSAIKIQFRVDFNRLKYLRATQGTQQSPMTINGKIFMIGGRINKTRSN